MGRGISLSQRLDGLFSHDCYLSQEVAGNPYSRLYFAEIIFSECKM